MPNKEPLYSAPLVTALLPEVDLDLKLAPHVYTAQMGEKGAQAGRPLPPPSPSTPSSDGTYGGALR